MLQLCLQGERGPLWEAGAARPVLPCDSAHRPGGCQRATPARPGPSLVVRRESSEPSELLCQVRTRSGKNSQPCFASVGVREAPTQARPGRPQAHKCHGNTLDVRDSPPNPALGRWSSLLLGSDQTPQDPTASTTLACRGRVLPGSPCPLQCLSRAMLAPSLTAAWPH